MSDTPAYSGGPLLLALAARSIRYGLQHKRPLHPDLADAPNDWRAPGATFVTLEHRGALRGCIGSILPRRPLANDVAENAFAAAFRDHRFAPVTATECATLEVSISLLGPLTDVPAASEADVLAMLRPHHDGVLIFDEARRAVFLPQVWAQLPNPADFLAALKQKGGFPKDSWPAGFKVQRFSVTEIPATAMAELN